MRKSATAKWMFEQGPCKDYTLARIEGLWGDDEALTPHQIAKLVDHPTDPISLSDVGGPYDEPVEIEPPAEFDWENAGI